MQLSPIQPSTFAPPTAEATRRTASLGVALSSKDIVVRIQTRRGGFRIHFSGEDDDLEAVSPIPERLANAADGPDEFLEGAVPELERHNVMISDVYGIGPKAPDLSIVDRVRMIMHSGSRATAEDCYIHPRTTFQIAEPEQIEDLMRNPDDLMFVTNYIRSVLDDLDENAATAADEMRDVLDPAAYFVLGLKET
jgi:hypothetical protein